MNKPIYKKLERHNVELREVLEEVIKAIDEDGSKAKLPLFLLHKIDEILASVPSGKVVVDKEDVNDIVEHLENHKENVGAYLDIACHGNIEALIKKLKEATGVGDEI